MAEVKEFDHQEFAADRKAEYWSAREEYDRRLGALLARVQQGSLRHAAALLLAAPVDAAAREAQAAVCAWAAQRVKRGGGGGGGAKRGKGGGKGKAAAAAADGWAVHDGLLRAACEAAPALDDATLDGALAAALRPPGAAAAAAEALRAFRVELREAWATHGGAAEAVASGARGPLVLVVDERLQALPWESTPLLDGQPACRLPSAEFVSSCDAGRAALEAAAGGVRSDDAYFVLNPSGDLLRTQKTFERRFRTPPWEGVVGERPEGEALRAALRSKHLFVYCGHGHGSEVLLPLGEVRRLPRCSVSLLMGCSSGVLTPHGAMAPSGAPLDYLHASCPALVANLWDVTDGDCDKLTTALLDRAAAGGSLLAAVAHARAACRLRYLTGAAAVCYGLPVATLPRGEAVEGVEAAAGKGGKKKAAKKGAKAAK